MPRNVKCQDTGEIVSNSIAYKAPTGKYFSSEIAYKKWVEDKEYRTMCIHEMYSLMEYHDKMIIPGVFNKKLAEYAGVGYKALYGTMLSQKNNIEKAIKTKQFTSESAKVLYIMAILNNNVMDEYKKLIREEKQKAIADKHESVTEIDNFESLTTTTQKGTDVSSLLGNEDWI